MADVEVSIERLEGRRSSESLNEDALLTYSVDVSLTEKTRGPRSISLEFSLELTTQPTAVRLFVSGTATIDGVKEEIDELLRREEDEAPPVILVRIYQRVYASLYLLTSTLKVPSPLPGLMTATGGSQTAFKIT